MSVELLLEEGAKLQAMVRYTRSQSTPYTGEDEAPAPPPAPGSVRAPTKEETRERLRSEQIEERRRTVTLMQLHAERGLIRTFVNRIDQEIEAVSHCVVCLTRICLAHNHPLLSSDVFFL